MPSWSLSARVMITATELAVIPWLARLRTTTRYMFVVNGTVLAVKVKKLLVALTVLVTTDVEPRRHSKLKGKGLPAATALKVTVAPAATICDTGPCTMVGETKG